LPDKDIINEKINNIQRCLRRISDVTKGDKDSLDNFDVQDIFILNLQRAIQAAIDLAVHIVSDEGWGVARMVRENFNILKEHGIIESSMAEKLKRMVGFRNLAIHDYTQIDIEILKNILKHTLGDIEEFYTGILENYHLDQ